MPVTVVTPAESRKLTTVTAVKTDLGISGSGDDAVIGEKIEMASRRIVSFCRREFAREIVTETLPGYGGNVLMLERTPVTTLTSVSYRGVAVDAANYSLSDREVGHVWNDNGWTDTAYRTNGLGEIPAMDSRKPDYSVVYTGGFWLPSFTATSGTAPTDPALLLPSDIELAARELAKSLYKGRRRDQAVKQESAVNVGSVTYHGGADGGDGAAAIYGGLPPFIAEMLLPYKRPLL